ncbi:NADPH:quinone reductase [Mesorhizobium sp. Z1-4]|uniref:NADPH:quinone reductase n=1 Tax=Mesorhizobium sp. Z1-4 TaxID=2448478 RepID=UPI000FDA3624|nr:NADPH:quinone reductase [Mesorhizobium sp. Z1-4]
MARTVEYTAYGPARDVLKIVDRDIPEPTAGNILVRVMASGVNPSDVKKRGGWGNVASPTQPIVPHADGAGVVEAVGPDADPSWVGKRVWIFNAQGSAGYGLKGGPESGTACEYTVVPPTCLAPLPDEASFSTGACLGVPAITAHYAVFSDGPVKDKLVLVQGGAGAVGELAIQFAARAGAKVMTTVSSPAKAEIAHRAGAAWCIDRKMENVTERVLALTDGGVDRIIEVDFGANAALDASILAIGGSIAAYSSPSDRHPTMPYYELQMRAAVIRLISNVRIPRPRIDGAIAAINEGLSEGWLSPTIAREYALADVALAHEAVEHGRAIGQTVVGVRTA